MYERKEVGVSRDGSRNGSGHRKHVIIVVIGRSLAMRRIAVVVTVSYSRALYSGA